MQITGIRMTRCQNSGRLKAIANITLDCGLALNDLRLIENLSGDLHVHFPAAPDSIPSKIRYLYNPTERRSQQLIEQTLIREYRKGATSEK